MGDVWNAKNQSQPSAVQCHHASFGTADAQPLRCRRRDAKSFAMGILGDLHLEPDKMELHEEARRQFRERLQEMDPLVCCSLTSHVS